MNPRTLNREMDRIRKKLGGRWLKKNNEGDHFISPHSFRRSWITRWINQHPNTSPYEAAEAIGHSDPRTTFQYFQHTDELENKIEIFVKNNTVEI